MASCKFQGGKFKGAIEAKAHMRHNDISKERRMAAKKKNKHIDLEKTKDNFSILGLSYEECCARYDDRIAYLDGHGNTNRRRDRVSLVSIEIPAPADLPECQYKRWFSRVSEIVVGFFGGAENMIQDAIHLDERHQYIGPGSKEKVWSRAHGHFCGVPEINGRLNAKRLTSRANIKKLNREVDEMTKREFRCIFMTGEKKKSFYTVEGLKEMSAHAEYEMELAEQKEELEKEREQLRAHREALERREHEIEEKEENTRKIRGEAEEAYRDAVRLEQEARERMQAAEDADQPQEEKTRGRELPWEYEMLWQKMERERLGLPEPDMKQVLEELRHRRTPGGSKEVDTDREAQAEEGYRVPFEFLGLIPSAPSDGDEMGF